MRTASNARGARSHQILRALGDHRSTRTRLVAAAAILATFFGPLYAVAGPMPAAPPPPASAGRGGLPDDQVRRSSERVRPVMVSEADGKVSADRLWRLFDGDARTGLGAAQPVTLRLTFASAIAIDAVGAYGPAAGVLSVLGTGATSAGPSPSPSPSIDLTAAGASWSRVMVPDGPASRSLSVKWTPRSPDAVLPELEIWGRGSASVASSSGPALEEALYSGLPDGAEAYGESAPGGGERHISAATPLAARTFSISMPMNPASVARAFLVYDLADLPHFTAARRAINDGPAIGGFGVSLGAKGGLAVEEISPATLRRGANSVRFDPASPTNPAGYRVGHVRLVVTHASTARAVADVPELEDGKESTGWRGGEGSASSWRFSGPAQPRELELRLSKGQEGTLVVVAGTAAGGRNQVKVDLSALAPGWHKVALDALPPVEALTVALAGGKEGALFVSELTVTGSPLLAPSEPRFKVTYPLHGECVNHQVHVRGLATPAPGELRANGAPVRGASFEPGAFSFTASEKELGGGAGKPFHFTVESIAGPVRARREIAIQGCVDRPPVAAARLGAAPQPAEDTGAPYGVVVTPDRAATLTFGGATLEVPAGAVTEDVRLTIRPLPSARVPALDAGMVNVTAGGGAFRLGPRGMKFEKPVALTVPVDATRVDPDEHARPFYFDEGQRAWREVSLRSDGRRELTAETTHFTDFIAATMKAPEHPGLQSLNPTALKDIKLADPAAGVPLMAAPEPNAQGTANLSYPIAVPPGRRGMQPTLAINYDSAAGNGWLGTGWSLDISSIEIDTRRGVPRYDGNEPYALDGQALTPATAAPAGAPAGTYFWRRREGRFDWIQRVTQSTGVYYWVVTDKAGTKYTYGQADQARLMPLTGGTPDRARTFKWFLEKTEDVYGNQILYSYFTERGTLPAVAPDPGEPYVQVYPSQITYTLFQGATTLAPYKVVFTRQTGVRADAFSTGRPGFQVLTQRLLDRVDVMNGTAIVRRYALTYVAGDFGKNLLRTISVLGKGGTGNAIAQHTLDYHQVPRDSSNNPRVFGTPAPSGYVTVRNTDNSAATSTGLTDAHFTNGTWGLSVGIASGSHTEINSSDERFIQDLDGDGLPDWTPAAYNQEDGNKQSVVIQADGSVQANMSVASFPYFAPHTKETTQYMSSSYSLLGFTGGEDYGNISETIFTKADMNGDGILDSVSVFGDSMSIGMAKPHAQGGTGQVWTGYKRTGLGFDCNDIFANGTAALASPESSFPSADIVTRWIAPYAGNILITGNVQRPADQVGGDGLVASLYLGSSLLWEREFGPTDTAACTPAGPGLPEPGSTCGAATSQIWKTVAAGDRIYTRVNAKGNADHDVLDWNLTIKYRTTPTAEDAAVEPWGPKRYTWSEKTDQRVTGQFYKPWVAVTTPNGRVRLEVQVNKTQQTGDDVQVLGQLYRPSTGFVSPLIDKTYLWSQTTSNDTLSNVFDGVQPGDEIHVWVKSELPIDPDVVRVLPLITYERFCRNNPYVGGLYCGTPVCTPIQTETGAGPGTQCNIVPVSSTTDPQPNNPVPGTVIKQIGATYYPLQEWRVQRRPGDSSQTVDGRQVLLPSTNFPSVRLCYNSSDPANAGQTVILAVQGVNKLVRKLSMAGQTGEISTCLTVNGANLGANQQAFMSLYAQRPLAGAFTLTGFVNNVQQPASKINIYYPDTRFPVINRFPNIGRAADMSAGFHDLYTGTWNGNKVFDPAMIVATGNTSYLPLFAAPMPADAVAAGQVAFLDGLVDFLSDAWTAISSAASYIWDSAVGAAKIVGSYVVKGIRALGSIAGKIMAWAVCELGGESYEAIGVRLSETKSNQTGFELGFGVAHSAGTTVSGLDLMDMNGDLIPDQVSTAGVRYAFYDPVAKKGQFCTVAPPNCPDAPATTIPGKKLREVSHSMHSANIGSGGSPTADAQAADAQTNAKGVQVQISVSDRVSQGYSQLNRDLRDVNGDGLPDVVDVNGYGMTVRLNYGYRFGNPIVWSSPAWTNTSPQADSLLGGGFIDQMIQAVSDYIANSARPTSATLRLEEEGHKGGAVGVGVGIGSVSYGLDQTYERTLVDLVDVNGDGLPDQLMKMPGDLFRVKLNRGTSFGAEIPMQADAWPDLNALFIPSETAIFQSIRSADAISFSRSDSYDFNVGVVVVGGGVGEGDRRSVLSFMDIDGDGRVDHVLKNGDVLTGDSRNGPIYARLNQTGKSNLLSKVTRPLGGTIELDYKRTMNVTGTYTGIDGVTQEVEIPTARWDLSRLTVTDGRGNRYTDQIDNRVGVTTPPYPNSGFWDRDEREFYGYSRMWLKHGIAGPNGTTIEGDGSVKYRYFLNQSYHEQGLLLAEYDIDANETVLRGAVTQHTLAPTPNTASPSSQFEQSSTTLDLVYEGTLRDVDLFASNPAAVFDLPEFIPDAPVWKQTNRGWDQDGNLTTVADFGDPSTTADDVLYRMSYATFTGQRFTALSQIVATTPSDLNTALALRQSIYVLQNNRPRMIQFSDFIYGGIKPVTGAPWTGQARSYNLTWDDATGGFGNLQSISDPTGYTLTFTYDTTTKTHATTVKDGFNLQSSSTVNFDFGLPATTTDVNGKLVTYSYDAYGRPSKVWGPTDPTSGVATIQMDYSQASGTAATVPWARTKHKDFQSATDTIDTVTFADGLGRVIQTKKEAEVLLANGTTQAGYSVSGLVVFDAHGRVLAQHQPVFDSATAATTLVPAPQKNPTIYAYDGLGRTKLVSLPDGNLRSTRFYITRPGDTSDDGLPNADRTLAATGVTDEKGHVRRSYTDGNGRVVATKLIHFPITGVDILKATYDYDRLGHLTRVTELNGNDAATASYDSVGRMVSMWMRDTGTTTFRYNLAGQLAEKRTEKLTAAGQVIKYTYDQNRLKTIDYPTMADVVYDYGTSTETGDTNGNRAGRIKTITMEGGTEQRSYDAFGNVSQTVTTLGHIGAPATTKPVVTMKYGFDWMGRMRTMTFPRLVDTSWNVPTGDGEVITYTYDKGGMIDRISGKATPTSTAENYLNDVGYDEFGARTRLVSGNTIANDYGYDVRRRLSTLNATARPTSGAVQFHALAYTYDPVGNITKITNSPPQAAIRPDSSPVGVGPMELNYWYDDIDRLEGSNGRYRGHATYGYRYQNDLRYDAHFNLKEKSQGDYRERYLASDVGFANAQFDRFVTGTSYTLGYSYLWDGEGGGHDHVADTIFETDATGIRRTRTVSIDPNGNNLGDSYQGTTRANTWDEANRLKSTATNNVVNGRYLYNPDGERTQKQNGGGNTTFYFNQFLVIHGDKTVTKHLYAGDTRVASKTESTQLATPVRHFYHPDHLGSTSYITDANQGFVQHERNFPFGERWADGDELTTGALRRDWLFTGKELDRDTSGLYYFGARYMDARTSQWMSADPIAGQYMQGSPSGGFFRQENLGTYAYAWNNPVRLIDPDGSAVYWTNHGDDCLDDYCYPTGTSRSYKADMWSTTGEIIGDMHPKLGFAYLTAIAGQVAAVALVPGGLLALRAMGMKDAVEYANSCVEGNSEACGRGFLAISAAAFPEGPQGPGLASGAGKVGRGGKVSWKSVPGFGHAFSRHGAGPKITKSLTDRARPTPANPNGTPQGQWLDNQAAADFLQSQRPGLEGPVDTAVPIPPGLGQVIMPDGSIVAATRARLLPNSAGGYRDAFPIPGPAKK